MPFDAAGCSADANVPQNRPRPKVGATLEAPPEFAWLADAPAAHDEADSPRVRVRSDEVVLFVAHAHFRGATFLAAGSVKGESTWQSVQSTANYMP